MANSQTQGLWRAWRVASPFYRSIRKVAERIGISESYLARIEKGAHNPSLAITHQLVRLYLPAHVPESVVISVAESILRIQASDPDEAFNFMRKIWSLGTQHGGTAFTNFHQFVWNLNSNHLFGHGEKIPEKAINGLSESGYQWLLYRWIVVALATNTHETEEIIRSIIESCRKYPTQEHLGSLLDLPIPSLAANSISDRQVIELWSEVPTSQKHEVFHLLKSFTEQIDGWPTEQWRLLKQEDRCVVQLLIERLVSSGH